MRQSKAAYALVHRSGPGGTQWLAQWNQGWQAYNFVGGHKKAKESYHECAVREVKEELGLRPDREFSISAAPLTRLQYQAWSKRANEPTDYFISLFELTLPGAGGELAGKGTDNRWLTEDEIRRCVTLDGQAVSSTMKYVLTQANLWKDCTTTNRNDPQFRS